ncbi:CAP domain-containing protein [Cupriavidus consociatus]|uniref:CAP domain-containing protein n=1 Tax=Cupriavidus consociatus TaxID=2821357 RepID=UPI001AE84761|nr:MULTISPECIES: CAP domain-containing protein [unclassified Cupriavidus]MBP0623437.1 CAP domain-containing protein [Cupriavidus sp. LEh25]MDK2660136.1 CAP domain-containing protein [Cupriavidus sp. LEh21]
MQNSKFALSVLATAMTLALTACGGGGGDDGGSKNPTTPPTTPTTPTTPQEPTSVPPATSAPAATYPGGDLRLAAFNALNDYRIKMGVGALKQDAALDVAADNHLGYLKANSAVGHEEAAGKPGFTGANPYDQSVAAGASKDQWISQAADGSIGCLADFRNSVYHLQGITGNQETIGLAIRDGYCVMNFGVKTGANGSGYGLPQWGGQQMATNALAYSPVDGENVPGTFTATAESPSPAPDLPSAGHPVMFRVPAPTAGDVLTVSSFTLTGPGGSSIPARILVATGARSGSTTSAISDPYVYSGVAFLLPTQPLTAGTYTATFAGARNGVAINKSWSFTAF